MGNLARNLLDAAAKEGSCPALRMGDTVLTYDRVSDAAGRVAAGLGRGVTPGDRVGLVLPDVLFLPVVYYGALMAGAAVVPMNPLLKAREIVYYLRGSGARLVVATETSARAAVEGVVGVEAGVEAESPDHGGSPRQAYASG
ncbi:MAG: Long-chain-fatty-acid--CoA ligase [Modestobacter sp.]|nr:Long-chain-fatty-acid--CoA ligase [Modestobacter sp.]